MNVIALDQINDQTKYKIVREFNLVKIMVFN